MATDGLRSNLVGIISHVRRIETLTALTLLFVMVTAAVSGVSIVLTGQDWGALLRSALLGLLLGWSLGLFRQSAWRTALIVVALGLIYIFLFPGGLVGKIIAVLAESLRLLPHSPALLKGETIDLTSWVNALKDFSTSTGIVAKRLQVWIAALVDNQPAFDPVAAALVWNALLWLVSAWAGWVIEARRNALLASAPLVFLSVGTLAYGRRMSFLLYLMLGSLLLLLAVVQHDRQEQAWDESGAAYPARKDRQIIRTALFLALALVIFSALTSSISVQRIQEWISERTRSTAQQNQGDLGKSLGIIPGNTAVPDVFEAVRSPGLPEDHLIGSGPELSQRIVMTVAVDKLPSLSQGGEPLHFYWRGLTYDTYTGNGWRTSGTESRFYETNQLLQANHAPDHILIQQDVYPVEDLGGRVYAAGEPVAINLQSEAAWRSSDDLFGVQIDQSRSYEALSLIPLVDERTLRNAGQKYPDWIRRRYLALPTNLPDRVKALAIELTASEPTPYDRAKAIESYLRTFPYSLDVARPPLDRDVVDYFLFDLKKGYCDYYASAMVVLARAAGVPARLAIGYANGTYNLNSKRFVVTEADAHSWVEVYFPKIGWVPFEPTAGRPPLVRETTAATVTKPLQTTPATTPQESEAHPVWLWLLGGIGSAAVLGILWILFGEIKLRRMSNQAAAIEVYRRLRRYGDSLGVPFKSSDTPYEFTASLTARLQGLMRENFGAMFTSNLLHNLQRMTMEIVRTFYRPVLSGTTQDSEVVRHWMGLRWNLKLIQAFNYWEVRTGYLGRKWAMKFAWVVLGSNRRND
ncbi:MAG: transglutaminaseTgpA domain-containing protein [Anaerolineales bacterium]